MTRKLIIFDLNKVLIHRIHVNDLKKKNSFEINVASEQNVNEFSKRKDGVKIGNTIIWLRPKIKSILRYCSRHFDIALWTCCNKKNTDKCLTLFNDINFKFIWNAIHCKKSKINNEIYFYKDLNSVWNKMVMYNTENTIIIDDSAYKVEINPKHNYYTPKPWDYKVKINGKDELFLLVSKLKHHQGSIKTFNFVLD